MQRKGSITRIISKTTPLCFLSNGILICYRKGRIIGLVDGKVTLSFPFPVKGVERWFGWNRLATRLFRWGVRTAIAVDDSIIILCIGNRLYEFNIATGKVSDGWECGQGIRPLIFTDVKGVAGILDGIYFGGYLRNREKKPVNVYRRVGVDKWEVVYTFPQGAINHVHNILADPYRNCLWLFTGDFGESAAIWRVTNNFSNVKRIVSNDQQYRACVVNVLPEGLLYATDSPYADNSIYLFNPETHERRAICPIDGSCIYGCRLKDDYIFSSTVEGDGRKMNRWEFLFTRKRGAGIKDNFVHLYTGNLIDGFKEIYREEKDCFPLYTFQFGVFRFPSGRSLSDTVYFQPVATKKYDNDLLSIHL